MTDQDKIDDYEAKMANNIRPYEVTTENLDKISSVGGIDKKLLQADLIASMKAFKPLIVHLKVEDVRRAGGLG